MNFLILLDNFFSMNIFRCIYKQLILVLALGISYSTGAYAQPANDDCSGAIALTVSSTCVFTQYTNVAATSSAVSNTPSCGGYQGGDVWFKVVVPASGAIDINTNTGTITDGAMSLYIGSCGSLTEVACDDDGGNNGLMPFISKSGLTPGSTVYIRFWEYNGDFFGTFSICVSQSSTCSNGNPSGCSCPTPGATDCYLLPDISAGKRTLNATRGWTEYGQFITGVNKGLVRLDVSTPNVGWGPMEVTPTNDYICGGDTLRNFFPSSSFMCPDGSYPKRLINQRIYHKMGNSFQFELRPAGYMQYHPAHGHIHLDGWGLYTLRLRDVSVADTLKWPIVNSGIKVSFCLIDLSTCTGALGDCVDLNGNILNNQSFPNYGLGGGYNCGNLLQGISVGKVDIYGQYLDESFVKVPYEACNGEYHLVVQIDPDNHFQEINENNNWLEAKVNLTNQRASNTGPYAYIFSSKGNVMCSGDSLKLHASGASTYLWSNGATTQDVVVRQPGRYWVKATTPCGIATSDTLDVFTAGASSYPTETRQDTVCNGQQATLYASGNAHWYDAPSGGNLIYVGNNFQTGTLNQSTTFYVADQPPTFSDSVGARWNAANVGNYTATAADYIIFNAFQPFHLKTVKVNASTAGIRYIQLRDIYGKVIFEKAVVMSIGVQEILVDFFVPSGLNLQLGVSATGGAPNLFTGTTASANIGYPFKVDAVMNIVGSSIGDNAYPFFYDWKIESIPQTCNDGSRLPITAVVAPNINPSISGIDALYLHTDQPVLAGLTPPGGALSGNGVLGNTFNPSVAGVGVHTLTYTYTFGRCVKTTSIQTEVKFDSSVIHYDSQLQLLGNPGPNPQLNVVSDKNSTVVVKVFNSVGQLVKSERWGVNRGNNIFDLSMEKLAKGVYILDVVFELDALHQTFKLVK